MITIADFVKEPGKYPYFECHMLDAVAHAIRGDLSQTAYGDQAPSLTALRDVRNILAEEQDPVDWATELQSYKRKRKAKPRFSDSGEDLSVEKLIDQGLESDPFWSDIQVPKRKPALNILMELNVPYGDRASNYMEERHKRIYSLLKQAMQEGRPTRVISCETSKDSEHPTTPLRMYLVVKDWNDPFFPGLWGVLRNCALANSWANVIADYILGTHDSGNGRPAAWDVAKDLGDAGDLMLLYPRTLTNSAQAEVDEVCTEGTEPAQPEG